MSKGGGFDFTSSAGGNWNIGTDSWEPGHYYYNSSTNQIRFMDSSGAVVGAWLRTLNLDKYEFRGGKTDNMLDWMIRISNVTGITGSALELSNATFRLANSKGFSPKIYASGWKGGGSGKITTYNVSALGKGISTGAGAVSTTFAYVDIYNGDANALTYSDAAVGTTSLTNSIAGYLGFAEVAVIGEFAAAYSWVRLWQDIGFNYGPSHWYGKDDTKWFK